MAKVCKVINREALKMKVGSSIYSYLSKGTIPKSEDLIYDEATSSAHSTLVGKMAEGRCLRFNTNDLNMLQQKVRNRYATYGGARLRYAEKIGIHNNLRLEVVPNSGMVCTNQGLMGHDSDNKGEVNFYVGFLTIQRGLGPFLQKKQACFLLHECMRRVKQRFKIFVLDLSSIL
jgi:hypothetical protein